MADRSARQDLRRDPGYLFTDAVGRRIRFRPLRRSDAALALRFINPIARERRNGILVSSTRSMAEERRWLRVTMRRINDGEMVDLVAEDRGAIVGNCHVLRRGLKQSHRAVIGIALTRRYRGSGIGERLLRTTIAHALRRMPGIRILELSYIAYNARAARLYCKLGFRTIGRVPGGIQEPRRTFDEVLMAQAV